MNFYKIINNERALLTFIETLPNLEVNEVYLITLLWRGKYSKNNEKKRGMSFIEENRY